MEVDTTLFNAGNLPRAWCTLSQTGGGSITIVPGNSSQDLSTVTQGDIITWAGSANVLPQQATVNITSIEVTESPNPFGAQSPGTTGAYGTTVKATCNTPESEVIYKIHFDYNGTDYVLDPKITVNMGQDEKQN